MGIWSLMKSVVRCIFAAVLPSCSVQIKSTIATFALEDEISEWFTGVVVFQTFGGIIFYHVTSLRNQKVVKLHFFSTKGPRNEGWTKWSNWFLESSEFTCPSLHSGNMSSVNSLLPVYKFVVCRLKSSSHVCFLQIRQQQVRADETSRKKSNSSQHLAWPLATSEHPQKTSKNDPIVTPKKHLACKWHCAWTWPTRKCYKL